MWIRFAYDDLVESVKRLWLFKGIVCRFGGNWRRSGVREQAGLRASSFNHALVNTATPAKLGVSEKQGMELYSTARP